MQKYWLYGAVLMFGVLIWTAPSQAVVEQQTVPPPVFLPVVLGPAAATATVIPLLTPTVTAAPTPTPTSTPTPTPTQAVAYACSNNFYNCADFVTHDEAQAVYDYCMAQVGFDVHRLDRDNDGIACEALPVRLW